MWFSKCVSIQYIFIKVSCPYQFDALNVFLILIKTTQASFKQKMYSTLPRIPFQILYAKLDGNVTVATKEWNYSSITTSN